MFMQAERLERSALAVSRKGLARNAGVEPATSGFVDRRSIQLS